MKYLENTPRKAAWVSGVVLATILAAGFTTGVNFGSVAQADEKLADEKMPDKNPADKKPSVSTGVQTEPTKEAYQPKTERELHRALSKLQYYVTQEEGTEKAFRNLYWNNKKEGDYHCVVCDSPLFKSEAKFKSGTGWPSFFAPVKKDVVGLREDWKLFYSRTEVHCQRCGAHLGHVFDDGPKPTGKRYCMNSASLTFFEKDERKTEDSQEKDDSQDTAGQGTDVPAKEE